MVSVLVIEDNPASLELMTYLLKAYGYETVPARDGEEGLALVGTARLELVVCDIQLPRLDGYDVVRRLKATPGLAEMPVVAVTAYAMVGDREQVLRAGFDGYISKPIAPETFVAELESFLPPALRASALPRAERPPAEAALPPLPREPEGRRRTVLVVDNLPANIDIARGTLEPLGYTVVGAGGVEEGFSAARRCAPDLILCDLHMLDGNGYDLLDRVKAEAELRPIPFVLVSSSVWGVDEAELRDRGAAKFLQRPIEPQKFLDEVEPLLAGGKEG